MQAPSKRRYSGGPAPLAGLTLSTFTAVHDKMCSLSFLSKLLPDLDLHSVLTVQSFMKHGGMLEDDKRILNKHRFVSVFTLLNLAPFALPLYFTRTEDAFVCVQLLLVDKVRLWLGITDARQRLFPQVSSIKNVRWPVLTLWVIFSAWGIAAYLPIAAWWATVGAHLVRAEGTIKLPDARMPSFEESHVQAACMHIVLLAWATKCSVQCDGRIQKLGQFLVRNRLENLEIKGAGTSLKELILRMEVIVKETVEHSRVWPVLRVITVCLSIFMAIVWRCIRLALNMPAFPAAIWSGPLISACWIYAHMHAATVIGLEAGELFVPLFESKLRTKLFSCLSTARAASVVGLPVLATSNVENLELWNLLRSFLHMRNPLVVRWLECVISIIVLDVAVVTALTLTAVFSGGDVALTVDTQTVVLWAFCVFFLMTGFVCTIILLAVAIGKLFRDDLPRVRREMLDTEMRLHRCAKTMSNDEVQDTRACQEILGKMLDCLDKENEFLEIFGLPLDERVKGAIISFALANLSSTVAIVVLSAVQRFDA
jgi:hypothetical protein